MDSNLDDSNKAGIASMSSAIPDVLAHIMPPTPPTPSTPPSDTQNASGDKTATPPAKVISNTTSNPSTSNTPSKPLRHNTQSEAGLVELESIPVTATIEKVFTPSAILQLPEEVRRRIYRYAMFSKGTDYAPRPHFSSTSCWRIKPPAILHTCYEMRQEALKIYYGQFSITARSARDLVPFLRSLDPSACAVLGKVSLKYEWYDEEHQTIDQQIKRALEVFRKAGVEVKKGAIEITGVAVTN